MNPSPLNWELGVLTTGPPGKSPEQISQGYGSLASQASECLSGSMYSAAPPEDPRLADHGYAAQSWLMDTQSLTGLASDLPSLLRGDIFHLHNGPGKLFVAFKSSTKISASWSPVVMQRVRIPTTLRLCIGEVKWVLCGKIYK